jgi:hypothetical protein
MYMGHNPILYEFRLRKISSVRSTINHGLGMDFIRRTGREFGGDGKEERGKEGRGTRSYW